MASADGGARAGPAANRRPSPGRPGPSPHAGWCASPHGRWRGHPARGREPAGGGADCGGQHGSGCDLLSVNLTSVHVFEGFLCLIGRLKLHVGIALGKMGVEAVHGQVNHLDLPVGGEDLLNVLPDDVPGQPSQVDLGRFRGRAPATPVFIILLHRL